MDVYIDTLFLINFFMDTVLLTATARIMRVKPAIMRIFVGALFLSIYGVMMFLPELKFMYGVVGKVLSVSVAVTIVFGRGRALRNTVLFLGVAAVCGGAVYALCLMTDFGTVMGVVVSNGIWYMNINPVILIVGCMIMYFILEIQMRICRRNQLRGNMIFDIGFIYAGCKYKVRALIDTGCTMTEPLSGSPLLVVSESVMKNVELCEAEITAQTVAGRVELKLIYPETIWSEDERFCLCDSVEIAVAPYNVSNDGVYNALLNPEALVLSDAEVGSNCEINDGKRSICK